MRLGEGNIDNKTMNEREMLKILREENGALRADIDTLKKRLDIELKAKCEAEMLCSNLIKMLGHSRVVVE